LATVYGIVKQSGGYVWVYSEPGRGTTFKVYLPRAEGGASSRAPVVEETPIAGTETVLLVEDEQAVRALSQTLLERAGYRVLAAADPAAAGRLAESFGGRIDLLLTDVVMPISGGPALFRQLAARRPGLKVLYMSGYPDDTTDEHGGLPAGAAFLQKPFTRDALLRKVRETIDR